MHNHDYPFASTARLLRAAICFVCLLVAPRAFSQGTVSSGVTGIVRDPGGKPAAGVTVTAVHEPTGTSYSTTTSSSGRFGFGGMMVGGPYTVSATGAGGAGARQTDVTTLLGQTVDVNLNLGAAGGEIVKMAKFTVLGEATDLDSGATGAGSVITQAKILATPTVQRSFADMARTNNFVNLRSTLATRAQPIISAVGQNNRFNSIQVDGARINDQFGLNGSGLQAFGNPITLDTIEQFNVSVSPYDASQSGFTGASINAVTKSGTNTYSGTAYYYYTDQELQGKNVFGSTIGLRPPLKQKTKGITFGGPILKNRLFFFFNYERFDSITSDIGGLDPTGTAAGTADFTAITGRLAALKASLSNGSAYDFGTFPGRTATATQFDTKWLGKLDWNITSSQRVSVRYNKTEGELPESSRFKIGGTNAATLGATSGTGIATATFATNLTSNQYKQVRSEEVWASQLYSQWTPDLKTEVRYAQNEYSQATPTNIIFPEVRIFGVSGLAATGASISNGALVLGTEINRHGNFVAVKTRSYAATGEYRLDKVTFTGGYDRESSDFVNLFRSASYGVFDYASVAAFVADTPSAFIRNYYQTGTNPNDVSDFAINGLFAQAKWEPLPRLNLTLGLRYDWFSAGTPPPLNTQFQSIFGFANNGTVDGSNAISPRVSFNYAVTEERTLQVRGGVGHFTGRIPWVLVSNSWSNPGVGRGQTTFTTTTPGNAPTIPSLRTYLQTSFDPSDPIGKLASIAITRPIINMITNKLLPPSVWRGNLAADLKIPALDSVLSVEGVATVNDKALFIRDLNIKPLFTGSDGRQVYAGTVNTPANAVHPEFSNVYELSNIKKGSALFATIGFNRPMKNRWSYSLNYTLGSAEDALIAGETVAASLFNRNPIFNQNRPEVARSSFEIRNRIQAALTREFEFVKDHKTTVSLYYEGRTGNPYSYVYSGDANGDGVTGNDLVYVPTSATDPVLAGLTPQAAQSYMDYVNGSKLAKYRGSVAPRNAFVAPWVNRLDLHVAQKIPLHFRTAELEVFADFVNFGTWISRKLFNYHYQLTGAGDNELLSTLNFGNAAYNATTRQLQMTGAYVAPASPTPNNELSRWRIQMGARLRY